MEMAMMPPSQGVQKEGSVRVYKHFHKALPTLMVILEILKEIREQL
jgi:hypothetical protein